MDYKLDHSLHPTPHDANPSHTKTERMRCAICERRLGKTLHYLEETGDVPTPRQSWALCDVCNTAVRRQITNSTVSGPLRLRVAVGLVASERTPTARKANYGQMSDRHWETILFWSFLLFMLAHLAFIVVVASIQH